MDSENNTTIIVRDPKSEDYNFIISTWLRGNYYGNSYFLQILPGLYFKEYTNYINSIIAHENTSVQIACDEVNPHWIVGFIVYQKDALMWAYVKADYRKKGIASLLCKDKEFKYVSSTTKIGQAITRSKRLIFNPMKVDTHE